MSKIQWTDTTWNPVTGCRKVSPGCQFCYAATMAKRLKAMGNPRYQNDGPDGPGFGVTLHKDKLSEPLRWRKPRRVFVNSMSDLFHAEIPDPFIVAVFGVMAAAPLHTFQILTKRPKRMRAWSKRIADLGGLGPFIRRQRPGLDMGLARIFSHVQKLETVLGQTVRAMTDPWMQVFNAAACIGSAPLGNVWLGVSVESADYLWRVDYLRDTPAAVRFLSLEPLLGPLPALNLEGIHWVIVGGESGPGCRPMAERWVREILAQCQAAKVPAFVKQLGGHPDKRGKPADWPLHLRVREFPA